MNYVKKLKEEWEKSIFLISILVVVFTGLLVAALSIDLFNGGKEHFVNGKKIDDIYPNSAFAFLNQTDLDAQSNAFKQQEARQTKTIPPQDYRDPKVDDPIDTDDEIDTITVPPPEIKKIPPVHKYIRYLGYMKTPSGEMRAWMKEESIQNNKLKKTELYVSEEGEIVSSYVVTSFNENQVVLQTTSGKILTINKGSRAHILTIQP